MTNTRADVSVEKFSEYIFKPGADHGKNKVFESLGYAREHADELAAIYREQAAARYARGEFTLGKQDEHGRRITIEIELSGIGAATGKTSYLKSGWMIKSDGGISLNTPFTGFTR